MRADAVRRVWTIRAIPAALLVAALSACGGGGDTPVDPTPPPQTVASVTLSPTTAALTVPATAQLTATARDANGNAMNATIAWSSSASTVATVSQTGLVTSVGAGTAIITATAGAQSASATITVSVTPTSPYGPVVDKRDITSAGGTVGNADVAVTIPAGSFLTTRTIEVVRDTENRLRFKQRLDEIGVKTARSAACKVARAGSGRPSARRAGSSPMSVSNRMTTFSPCIVGKVDTRTFFCIPSTWTRARPSCGVRF